MHNIVKKHFNISIVSLRSRGESLCFVLCSDSPINPHWARVVGHGSLSLCVLHKEGLCPSDGDINRLMMMISD
jgi:hypothetical protein